MKKSQFVEMIRTIVTEELKRILPEVISEMYIKRLVVEHVPSREASYADNMLTPIGPESRNWRQKPTLEQAFEMEMERQRSDHPPEPLDNDDEGIYQQDGPFQRKNESVREKLLNSSPYAAMFDGVKPVGAVEPMTPLIPPTEVDNRGRVVAADPRQYGDFYKKLAGIADQKKPMKQSHEVEQRRLDEQRAVLDARKVR